MWGGYVHRAGVDCVRVSRQGGGGAVAAGSAGCIVRRVALVVRYRGEGRGGALGAGGLIALSRHHWLECYWSHHYSVGVLQA